MPSMKMTDKNSMYLFFQHLNTTTYHIFFSFFIDRCHRIGQTRPVVIFRLITQNTIDENIVQRAQAKRAIEKLIVHQDKFKSGITSLKETTSKVLSPKEILKILLNEVMTSLHSECNCKVNINSEKSTKVWHYLPQCLDITYSQIFVTF